MGRLLWMRQSEASSDLGVALPAAGTDRGPYDLIEQFLTVHPGEEFLTGKRKRPRPDTGLHYDISMPAKSAFLAYLEKR